MYIPIRLARFGNLVGERRTKEERERRGERTNEEEKERKRAFFVQLRHGSREYLAVVNDSARPPRCPQLSSQAARFLGRFSGRAENSTKRIAASPVDSLSLSLFTSIEQRSHLPVFIQLVRSAGHRAGSCLQQPVTRLRTKSRSAYVRAREPREQDRRHKVRCNRDDAIASSQEYVGKIEPSAEDDICVAGPNKGGRNTRGSCREAKQPEQAFKNRVVYE